MAPNEREFSNLITLSISLEGLFAWSEPQLPSKKIKTLFLSNLSKSRRLTSTFFPIKDLSNVIEPCCKYIVFGLVCKMQKCKCNYFLKMLATWDGFVMRNTQIWVQPAASIAHVAFCCFSTINTPFKPAGLSCVCSSKYPSLIHRKMNQIADEYVLSYLLHSYFSISNSVLTKESG